MPLSQLSVKLNARSAPINGLNVKIIAVMGEINVVKEK